MKKYRPLVKRNKRREELLSNKETAIIKKANRRFIRIFLLVGVVLLSIIVTSCIIDIFSFFYKINQYVGYVVLVILLLLILFLVIRPIIVALSTPCFTLDIIDYSNKKTINQKNYRKLKKVANNLIKGDVISEESKKLIEENISSRDELNLVLRDVYNDEITKKINKIVNESATKVLLGTAISQNNRFDSATVLLVNIRMIMRIVIACGYHPSYPQLYKLIAKVFHNALVAYTIQSINIDEIIFNGIDKLVKGALSSLPFISEITKSLTQGAANSLLTLRIGIITRKYLYEEFDIQAMMTDPDEINNQILEEAVIEADTSIDNVIGECKKQKKVKV